jgi:hypothetical protein
MGKDAAAITWEQHLLQIEKQTGVRHQDLEPVTIPNAGEYIWEVFWQLSAAAGVISGMGQERRAISYTEIHAYSSLYKIEFLSAEIDLIRLLDNTYLTLLNSHE